MKRSVNNYVVALLVKIKEDRAFYVFLQASFYEKRYVIG